MWDDKLRKPHWGEEVRFKRCPGGVQLHIQDWACLKFSLLSMTVGGRFTGAQYSSIVDQYVDTTALSEHFVDDALPTLFVGDIQDDLSDPQ